jgi:hypothetical protein
MLHEFDPALQADPDRFALAERAASLLDEASAGTSVEARATWRRPSQDLRVNPARFILVLKHFAPTLPEEMPPLLEVEIRDTVGTVVTKGIHELDVPDLRYRMIRLWGDVLEVRSKLLMRRLVESVGPDEELVLQ